MERELEEKKRRWEKVKESVSFWGFKCMGNINNEMEDLIVWKSKEESVEKDEEKVMKGGFN